jgi:hypothetical protein
MERICSQCHAMLAPESQASVCPACSGKLVERPDLPQKDALGAPPQEVDPRGILLPRRHALGGIITPQ